SILSDIDKASAIEWIETNGIGGFSSSTVTGANTRRYHGLLVAAVQPPTGRIVALSKIEETVVIGEKSVELSTNRYAGCVYPEGYKRLVSFELSPNPVWIYRAGEYLLKKELVLEYGENTVWLKYKWLTGEGVGLESIPPEMSIVARPLFAFRDYHHLTRKNYYCDMTVAERGGRLTFRPYGGLPQVGIDTGGADFVSSPDWYYSFEYDAEKKRGLDFNEDLMSPGYIVSVGRSEMVLKFSMSESEAQGTCGGAQRTFGPARAQYIQRKGSLLEGFENNSEVTRRLLLSADSFLVKRGASGTTVIAGYPWFTDWGRDTMISLPGLALSSKRYDIAQNILTTFSEHVDHGLIPNRFPDGDEPPAYNTVDAPLWFVMAVDSYVKKTGDLEFAGTIISSLREIIHSYRDGTINDIFMDGDYLISAGNETTQLTWMDARVGDWVVTPRHGKAVEINALWFNCLKAIESLEKGLGNDAGQYAGLAAGVKKSFEKKFWNAEKQCLFDVINSNGSDPAIRPNQVFAISLPGKLLPVRKRESILKVIEEKLLTPYGLRSLSPDDP
nr:amylo-alpha-1,6-glucosidase [Synergistaceae bacterium]